jgi:RNA polymerase sigma factor (sigma-70 family)
VPPPSEDAERFRALFEAHQRDVHAYVLRRALPGVEAADVAAEVFATVWRRLAAVPDGPETRPYLIGMTRWVLANAQRGQVRRARLLALLGRQASPPPVEDHAEVTAQVAAFRAALARLPPNEREAFQLVAWEGLRPHEAAVALGCRVNTLEVRLSRARRRLRRLLTEQAQPATATPSCTASKGDDSIAARP